MQKLLTCLAACSTFAFAACSTEPKTEPKTDIQYETSSLDKLPFVFKMTIQQGNIITEEMVDRLEPGMTKSQIRYLMGTPILTDLFHTNRWDYTYTIRRGHEKTEIKRLTLFFEDDSLVKVQGDMRPDPERAAQREPADLLVSVPDWEDKRGFLAKAASTVGLEPAESEPAPPPNDLPQDF